MLNPNSETEKLKEYSKNKNAYVLYAEGMQNYINPRELWDAQDAYRNGTHRSRNAGKGKTKLLQNLMGNLFKG